MARKFTLSATSLATFMDCPYKFYLSRKYRTTEVPSYFRDGIDAHALMEGKEVPDASTLARTYARILQQSVTNWGMELVEAELNEYFTIGGVPTSRRIDAVMRMNGKLVYVDYKTGYSQWKTDKINGKEFSPKAMGVQASIYTYPVPTSKYPEVDTIFFVIASGQTLGFTMNMEEKAILDSTVRLFEYARSSKLFPKNRGNKCLGDGVEYKCPYYEICYKNNLDGFSEVNYSI